MPAINKVGLAVQIHDDLYDLFPLDPAPVDLPRVHDAPVCQMVFLPAVPVLCVQMKIAVHKAFLWAARGRSLNKFLLSWLQCFLLAPHYSVLFMQPKKDRWCTFPKELCDFVRCPTAFVKFFYLCRISSCRIMLVVVMRSVRVQS